MKKPKVSVPSHTTVRVGNQIADLLDRIGTLFKPGVKLTFLARTIDNDEADLLITSDDLHEILAAVGRANARDEIPLD